MAVNSFIDDEIKRKAGLGIKMSNTSPEKLALYNKYAGNNNPYAAKAPPKPVVPQVKQPTANPYAPKPVANNFNPVNKQPTFQTYNPSTYQATPGRMNTVGKNPIVQTHDDSSKTYNFGNSNFNQNQMNEIAYYDDMKSNLLKQRHNLTMNESKKGLGITEDFSRNALAPLQKQYYEIENEMLKKYGQFGSRGGESNDFGLYGLDRDSLGMNSNDENGFRKHDTAQEFDAQKRFIEQGLSAQKAYERVRGINPDMAYSPTNQFNNNNSMFANTSQNQASIANIPSPAQSASLKTPDGWGMGYGTGGEKKMYTDKNAEVERTLQVIKNRVAQGLNNDSQFAHYKNLTGNDYNAQQSQQPSSGGGNQSINSSYDQQVNAQMARFNAERDRALGLINQQKSEAATQYTGARNQADVVNAQNVSKLREMMASNGISASGENVTANVGLQSARQGALSQLNQQEQQQNNDFNRQIADASSQDKLNAMLAEIEAQRFQALYEDQWRNKEFDYGASRDKISDGRYADETQYNRGQDSKQWDYQTGRDSVSDGRYDKEWGYNVGRDALSDKRYLDELLYSRKQDALVNSRRGSSGGSGGSSSLGASAYAPQMKLPTNPTGPKIMTERQYIDAYEQSDARKAGTARVLPGSTDYAKKMQKVLSDLYK